MKRAIALSCALFLAVPALAGGTVSLGVTGGTLGIGPQIGYRFDRLFGVRGDATFLSFSHSFRTDDLHYDGHARLASFGGTLDLYPFGGGLRISGGARRNRNKADATATPTQNTAVGGMTFTPAQIGMLKGHGSVRAVAPQLTLGYGSKLGHGFSFGADFGALFEGRVRISDFTSSTGMVPQARLDQERDNLQHDVDAYRVYPIAQLSLGYRF